jgi:hypothetical protein
MRLTERDYDLLRYLAEQGVASSKQLADRHFPNLSSFWVRINKLSQVGLVEAVPLTTIKQFSQSNYFTTAKDLLGASRTDIWKYKVYRLGERFRKRWPSTGKLADVKIWRHQLMVNELRAVFEKKFPGALFLNDLQVTEELWQFRSFREGNFGRVVIPDLTVQIGERKIAVEIERTRKSENEYYFRLLDFRDGDYSQLLYYCESERIFKTLLKLMSGENWVALARFGTIHEVLCPRLGWMKLDDFLNDKFGKPKSRSEKPPQVAPLIEAAPSS